MIRKATLNDIAPILSLTRDCARYMISQGIYQWNTEYPDRATFENDIKRKELYVLESDNKIRGCIVISTFRDPFYDAVKWLTPHGRNLYIHRLAVAPEYQGHGYARQLMDFAERYGIENNYSSIRLDTFSRNPRNQKFYELRNYKRLEDIFFPRQSEYPFYCYERIL